MAESPGVLRPPHPLAVDAVLFDLDGTLADTAPDLAAALNRVRVDRGLAPVPISHLRSSSSAGARGLIGTGMGVAPDHPDYLTLRDAFLAHYESALCVDTTLFAEIDAVLGEIETRRLKWGIVTNKATRYTLRLLELMGLHTRPGVVVCGDTTPHTKPHPAPLLAAAAALDVAPARCVYVGDAERDIAAGVAAGMRTIIARYGYIDAREEPEAWAADGVIENPRDLLAWLPVVSRDTRPR
jgi:phosphoglycolate phosphatase